MQYPECCSPRLAGAVRPVSASRPAPNTVFCACSICTHRFHCCSRCVVFGVCMFGVEGTAWVRSVRARGQMSTCRTPQFCELSCMQLGYVGLCGVLLVAGRCQPPVLKTSTTHSSPAATTALFVEPPRLSRLGFAVLCCAQPVRFRGLQSLPKANCLCSKTSTFLLLAGTTCLLRVPTKLFSALDPSLWARLPSAAAPQLLCAWHCEHACNKRPCCCANGKHTPACREQVADQSTPISCVLQHHNPRRELWPA